jgi:hypothetical protein
MIWLSWRQFRVPALVAVLALAAVAVVLGVTNAYSATATTGGFMSHDHLLKFLSTALVGVPAIIGAFWGAPLVAREFETGTWRLAWTQSITRTRWLAVKVALIGVASVAVTGLLTAMLTAWSSPGTNLGRFGTAMFAERGVAPLGYAAFAFAAGVTAGVLLRRTVPAMAATLVAFLAARIIVQNWLRPHLATPLKLFQALSLQNGAPAQAKPGDWVLSDNFVNAAGHVVNNVACQGPTGPRGIQLAPSDNPALRACLAGYHQVLTYQPASRYWAFQCYETAIFTGVAVALIGCSFWWIHHCRT